MYRFLKIAHLLGLTLFLGSVFGHVVAAVHSGAPGSPAFLIAREEIVAATRALTLPGLGLAVLTGVGMALLAPGLRRQGWLWLHATLAGLVVASSLALVVPAGRQALAAAHLLAAGGPDASAATLETALLVERVGGSANILLAIALIAVGVIKPALRVRARHAASSRA